MQGAGRGIDLRVCATLIAATDDMLEFQNKDTACIAADGFSDRKGKIVYSENSYLV
jgi:hypothetical protein